MPFSILIIDDHETVANAFAKLLDSLGHKTSIACSGREALKTLSTNKPEIILLDIGMPTMDGYEVAKKIRSKKKFSETILVALTGHGRKEDKLKAREAGFDHHIEKPATLVDIERILNIYDY
ncbi:MAG: multi-sensor hybrid histidine kinase [uncultured bacterium]|nr:MAG: multi-sensor hybrid histidine kinase [uncultured bacterium]